MELFQILNFNYPYQNVELRFNWVIKVSLDHGTIIQTISAGCVEKGYASRL